MSCLERGCVSEGLCDTLTDDRLGNMICTNCGVVAFTDWYTTFVEPRYFPDEDDHLLLIPVSVPQRDVRAQQHSLLLQAGINLNRLPKEPEEKKEIRECKLVDQAEAIYESRTNGYFSNIVLKTASLDYFRRVSVRCRRLAQPVHLLAACVLEAATRLGERTFTMKQIMTLFFPGTNWNYDAIVKTIGLKQKYIIRLLSLNKVEQFDMVKRLLRTFGVVMDLDAHEAKMVEDVLNKMKWIGLEQRKARTIASGILVAALGGQNNRRDNTKVSATSIHKVTGSSTPSITRCSEQILASL